MEMLTFVLESSGRIDIVSVAIPMNGVYFKEQRKIIFYPDAETLSYSELIDINEGRIRALKSA